MTVLWDNTLKKIFIIFLCLGIILGIGFYLNQNKAKAETVNTSVTITICGNGIIETGEVCDDGNNVSGDGCSSDCLSDESCGNGIIDTVTGEECDDGNITSGDGCSSTCQTEAVAVCGDGTCNGDETCSSCPADCGICGGGGGGGGGGGVTPPPTTTKVILQGKAPFASYLISLKDGQVIANTQANSSGDFKIEISNITAGIYTFGIWAEDKNGIKSLTFSFTVNVVSRATTTVSGIFIPPTITISKDSVVRGETLDISGQTVPQAQVEIRINSDEMVDRVVAGSSGSWFYSLDTFLLEEGVHRVRARASTDDGLISIFSQSLLFGVGVGLPPAEGVCSGADLNDDGLVNLIDFSILLYWWDQYNECADQNNDGGVNLIDFSIMLYYWTG